MQTFPVPRSGAFTGTIETENLASPYRAGRGKAEIYK